MERNHLAGLAVNDSHIVFIGPQPAINTMTERLNQFQSRRMMIIEWIRLDPAVEFTRII